MKSTVAFSIALLMATTALAQQDTEPQQGTWEVPEFKAEIPELPAVPDPSERVAELTKKELQEQYIAKNEGEEMPKFSKWMATHNKNYQTMEEYNERMQNWKKHNALIHEHNSEADKSDQEHPARFAHNKWSDATHEEIMARYNYHQMDDGETVNDMTGLSDRSEDHAARNLQVVTQGIDWANLGFAGAVEDQGACGSCYSFTSSAALASAQSLTTGRYTRLSQQQIIDCTSDLSSNSALFGKTYGNFGCEGGSETKAWTFYKEQCAMAWEDYPYASATLDTGVAGTCQHDASKCVAKVSSHNVILDNINDMMGQLGKGPLTAQVAVEPTMFTFYSDGILTSDSRVCLYGPEVTNHAMFVVGYQPVSNTQARVINRTVTLCRSQEWYDEFYPTGCQGDAEYTYMSYCCWKQTYDSWFYPAGKPFFKVQNTWSTDWGDQGFAYFMVEGQGGVCQLNQRVFWVEVGSL